VTITMVSDPGALEAVVFGPSGVMAGARQGSALVDMSTVSPAMIASVGAAAKARGVRFLESPVTGGVGAAAGGSLTLMVGGDANLLERVRPLLATMATKVVHLGPLGAGSTMKLATQVLGGAIVACLAEVMVFGVKAGLDPAAMLEVLSERSRLVGSRTKAILTGDFRAQFSTQLSHKDVTLALEAARSVGVPMFVGAAVREVFTAGIAKGLGGQDYASIVTLFEDLAGVSCRAK
jgi:3-hydroxyisobutyrate dehydrogenase-like beta-hydroxyacid dehydrogenase